jgi:hypothetical protein
VRVDPPGRLDADHLAPQVARREDEVLRDDALRQDPLGALEVAEEQVERTDPLGEPVLHVGPLVGRDDARDEVEREDSVGAGIVPVDREPDPLREEEGVGGADALLEPLVGERREPLVEGAVVGRGRPAASIISSKNGPASYPAMRPAGAAAAGSVAA